MSSWFDEWDGQIQQIADLKSDDDFLTEMEEIEKPRVRAIHLVTGDRQFPDDLRERIQNIIALWSFSGPLPPTERAYQYAISTRCSTLSMHLHSAFHDVASGQHFSRFGRFSDNPKFILALRDEYDEKRQEGAHA